MPAKYLQSPFTLMEKSFGSFVCNTQISIEGIILTDVSLSVQCRPTVILTFEIANCYLPPIDIYTPMVHSVPVSSFPPCWVRRASSRTRGSSSPRGPGRRSWTSPGGTARSWRPRWHRSRWSGCRCTCRTGKSCRSLLFWRCRKLLRWDLLLRSVIKNGDNH